MPGRRRQKVLDEFWNKPQPHELDVIDKGDHLKVTSCNPEVAGWWLGTLKAVYPQDHLSGEGEVIKMHPRAGVTLKLNKQDGTLRIKGKKHLDWFQESFDNVLEAGAKEMQVVNEMSRQLDNYLRIQDSFTVHDLLTHLPASGAFKHGPSYIYRLWRGLLDYWVGNGADVYIVTPLLDSKRLADVLLMLVKHKLTGSRVHLMCLNRCDGDNKYPKILKDAKDMLRDLKGASKKRLIAEERIKMAEQRLDVRFGRFHCKLIAMCIENYAQVMVTSASFHKWHFELENGDTVAHFKLSTSELVNNYLAPLGLAHQVILDNISTMGGDQDTSSMRSIRTDRSSVPSMIYSGPSSPVSPKPPNSSPGPSSPHSQSVPSVAQQSSGGQEGSLTRSNPAVNHHSIRTSQSSQSSQSSQASSRDSRASSMSSRGSVDSRTSQHSRASSQMSPVVAEIEREFDGDTLTSQSSRKSQPQGNGVLVHQYSPEEINTSAESPNSNSSPVPPMLHPRHQHQHHEQQQRPPPPQFRLSPSPIRVEVDQNTLDSQRSHNSSRNSSGQLSPAAQIHQEYRDLEPLSPESMALSQHHQHHVLHHHHEHSVSSGSEQLSPASHSSDVQNGNNE